MSIIRVIEIPNCTWILEGDTFFCTHDETEVATYTEDHLGINGHYQTDHLGYECAECREPIEGSPDLDYADYVAESRLMEVLEK